MKLLNGKTALITGASRGIGKGIALKFAEQGANIAFTFLSSVEKGKELEKELAAANAENAKLKAECEKLKQNILNFLKL